MKRKLFLVGLFLVLAIFLAGCNTPAPIPDENADELDIKNNINNYCRGIKYQDWDLAKDCCIYGSGEFNAVTSIRKILDNYSEYYISYIKIYIDIYDVYVYGDYSEVYTYVTLEILEAGDVYSDSYYFSWYLQKISDHPTWKIDDGFLSWYTKED